MGQHTETKDDHPPSGRKSPIIFPPPLLSVCLISLDINNIGPPSHVESPWLIRHKGHQKKVFLCDKVRTDKSSHLFFLVGWATLSIWSVYFMCCCCCCCICPQVPSLSLSLSPSFLPCLLPPLFHITCTSCVREEGGEKDISRRTRTLLCLSLLSLLLLLSSTEKKGSTGAAPKSRGKRMRCPSSSSSSPFSFHSSSLSLSPPPPPQRKERRSRFPYHVCGGRRERLLLSC